MCQKNGLDVSFKYQVQQNQNGACEIFCQNKRCVMNLMVNNIRIREFIGRVKNEKIPSQFPKLSEGSQTRLDWAAPIFFCMTLIF